MELYKKLKLSRAETTAWETGNLMVPADMVTMISEVDASGLDRLRQVSKSQFGQAPTYTSMILKIVALTMDQNPTANRAILGWPFFKKLLQFNNVNISVAVEKNLPNYPGLAYAEPITGILEKSLLEITNELKNFAQCDETNNKGFATYMWMLKYLPKTLAIFLFNLADYVPSVWVKYRGCAAWVNAPSKAGVDLVLTTWPWPLTFSFGLVKARPMVVDGQVVARQTIPLVMAFDRRIMGGGPASRLFAHFQKLVETADNVLK